MDKGYLDFVYTVEEKPVKEEVRENFNAFKEFITPLMSFQIVTYGEKYTGKSFDYVKNSNDRNYIDFLKNLKPKDIKNNNIKAFEELDASSSSSYNTIYEKLKTYITSRYINIEKKNIEAVEVSNINNYILLSNHDIRDDDRSYFVLDVQTHRVGDQPYWKKVYSRFDDKEVLLSLYSYFYEIDTTNFIPQDCPLTENKKSSIAKQLPSSYVFLKENYIKTGKDLIIFSRDLYEEYQLFCNSELKKKPFGITLFVNHLKEVQIANAKAGKSRRMKYNTTHKTLEDIAIRNNWIHELDDYTPSQSSPDDKQLKAEDTYNAVINSPNQYQELLKECEILKKENQELKKATDCTRLSSPVWTKSDIETPRETKTTTSFSDAENTSILEGSLKRHQRLLQEKEEALKEKDDYIKELKSKLEEFKFMETCKSVGNTNQGFIGDAEDIEI